MLWIQSTFKNSQEVLKMAENLERGYNKAPTLEKAGIEINKVSPPETLRYRDTKRRIQYSQSEESEGEGL